MALFLPCYRLMNVEQNSPSAHSSLDSDLHIIRISPFPAWGDWYFTNCLQISAVFRIKGHLTHFVSAVKMAFNYHVLKSSFPLFKKNIKLKYKIKSGIWFCIVLFSNLLSTHQLHYFYTAIMLENCKTLNSQHWSFVITVVNESQSIRRKLIRTHGERAYMHRQHPRSESSKDHKW